MLLSKLQNFVTQRPGLEYVNYCDPIAMSDEQKKIARQKSDFITLARYCDWAKISDGQIREASRMAFSGRLSFDENGDVDYTTGQYWPVEYRAAACAVLAAAIWDHCRECGCFQDILEARRFFKKELGRGIASRWFY